MNYTIRTRKKRNHDNIMIQILMRYKIYVCEFMILLFTSHHILTYFLFAVACVNNYTSFYLFQHYFVLCR